MHDYDRGLIRRALEHAGFSTHIIERAMAVSRDDARFQHMDYDLGRGSIATVGGMVLTYFLFSLWPDNGTWPVLPEWVPVAAILFWVLLGLVLMVHPKLTRRGPVDPRVREDKALSYLLRLAGDVDNDPSGQARIMLERYARRLNAVDENAQLDELIAALDI